MGTVLTVVVIVVISAIFYIRNVQIEHPIRLIFKIDEPMQFQTVNGKLHLQLQDPNNGTPRFITGDDFKMLKQKI